jgi:hypothetical protein
MSQQPSVSRLTLPNKPSAKEVREFHSNADTDGSAKALHHTLGPGPSQAAPGNHTHDAGASSGLSGYATSDHTHTGLVTVTAWVTMTPLLNGWVPLAGVFGDPQYRKVGDRVELRGAVKSGTVSTTATGNIFVLPVGFRPVAQQSIMGVPINLGYLRLDLFNTGDIRAMASYITGGTVAFLSLENIFFSTV